MTTTRRDTYRGLHAAAFMALFCVGAYAASFGPVLPFLADDLGVSLDTAGLVLTALFIGSITASSLIAVALHATDTRLLTGAGLCSVLAGLLTIGFGDSWWLVLAGGAALGFGDGLVIAALHILMAVSDDDVSGAINRLNLWFAVGAVLGPVYAGAVLTATDERWIVYAGVAAAVAVTLAALIAAGRGVPPPRDHSEHAAGLPRSAAAWVMGALLFLYVGAEFGLGAWVSTYARETAGAGVFGAALLSSGYWLALLIGRVVSGAWFARGHQSSTLLAVSVAGAGLFALALALSAGNIAVAGVAAFGAGLFLGPVWPATLAIAAEDSANATATTVTLGNAGGVIIPWAQGRVLVGAGASQGVAVTAVLCAVMFVIVSGFRLRRRV